MAIQSRDLDVMVNDTLQRIVDANVGITNTNDGSVIKTIVESILNEVDIQYYQLQEIYKASGIDSAVGTDLDRMVEILSVVRKAAVAATGTVTFSITEVSAHDIVIQQGEMISTIPDVDGKIVEFYTTEQATLVAGNMSVDVPVKCNITGLTYIPIGGLCIMENSIVGIESVSNTAIINSGSDAESDTSLRTRAKSALYTLGKGTSAAVRAALLPISGVIDAVVNDQADGVGTASVVVVTTTIPPSPALQSTIAAAVADAKSAGVKFTIIYPTITLQDITVTTTAGTSAVIGKAITDYVNTLGVGDALIINQLERAIINACDSGTMDVNVTTPTANVVVDGTHIIRTGTITINGVTYNG